MSSLIGALRVSLGLDTANFEQGAAKSRKTADRTAGYIRTRFGSVGASIKSSLAGLAAGITAGAVLAAGKAALEYAASLGELAETLGVTTKDLQEFSYAAGQVGVSQETLEAGLQKLTISMGKAQLGAREQVKAFNAIGISVDDLKGKDAGEVFRLIAEKLQTVEDRSKRAAVEVALFGKAGAKLDNLLSGAEGSLNDLSAAAEKLGIVLSDEQIQNADKTADKIEALETVLKAKIAGVVADNASAIYNFASSIANLASDILTLMGAVSQMASRAPNWAKTIAGAVAVNPLISGAASLARGSGGAQSYTVKLSDTPLKFRGKTDVGNFLAPEGSHKKDHSAEELQRKQLEALQKAYDFSQDELRAQQDILEARKDLATDYVDQDNLQIQILDLQRQQYQAELDYKVKQFEVSKGQDGISKAQADKLLALYDQADGLKRQKVLQDEETRRAEDYAALDQADFERKRTLLEKQADLATTQAERRQIELDLLRLAYQEKEQALQHILETSNDFKEMENARRDLADLKKNYSLDRQGVMQQTAGPLESYLSSIPHTAAQMNEALQNLEVQGLNGLVDALSHVGEGWKAMRDIALQAIQDIVSQLIKLQLQKMLFSLIGSAAGSIGGGGGSLGSSGLGVFGSAGGVDAAYPTLFGGGTPGFATGGSFSIMGNRGVDRNMLSLNGLPIARVSHGERISVGNDNGMRGDAPVTINVNAPMSAAEARKTGSQLYAGWASEQARARAKGF
jgi:hypothetical protein